MRRAALTLVVLAWACSRSPRTGKPGPTPVQSSAMSAPDAGNAASAGGHDAALAAVPLSIDPDISALGPTIADLPARGHFLAALAKRRSDGPGQRSFRVLATDENMNAYTVTVEERITDASAGSDACQVGPFLIDLAKQDPQLPAVEVREIGTDCCPGTPCPEPTAMAAMLRFDAALDAGDLAAMRALVHPKRGLHVKTSWSSADDSGEDERRFTRAKLDLAKLEVSGFNWPYYEVGCGDFDGGGEASCQATAGGFGGSYTVLREGSNVFILDIEQSEH